MRHGLAGGARCGVVRYDVARCVEVWQVWHGELRSGVAWSAMVWLVRCGRVRSGKFRQGVVRYGRFGKVRRGGGVVRLGLAWQAR